jgi:hypothetical protein
MVAAFFQETNSKINNLARKQPLANRCSTGDFGFPGTPATVCVSFIPWSCDGRAAEKRNLHRNGCLRVETDVIRVVN